MTGLEIAAFVAIGVVAGAYGTMVGVGGGLFIVPILLFAHFAPKEAAGTSMAVVFANATSGTISFLRQRVVSVRTGVVFAAVGLPGALLGAYADQIIPRTVLSVVFGVFLLFMALRLFFDRRNDSRNTSAPSTPLPGWLALVFAFVAGFLASLFGIGGGIVYVPTMLYVLQFPVHIATATSTFAIALTALFGSASHAYYHDIVYGPAIALTIGAVVGAQFGARLAPHVKSAPLVRLFSIAVFLSGVWLIWQPLFWRR